MTAEWKQSAGEASQPQNLRLPGFMSTYRFKLLGSAAGEPLQIVYYTAERKANGRYEVCSVTERSRPYSEDRKDVTLLTAIIQPLVSRRPNSYSLDEALRMLCIAESGKTDEGLEMLPISARDEQNHYGQYMSKPCRQSQQQPSQADRLVA